MYDRTTGGRQWAGWQRRATGDGRRAGGGWRVIPALAPADLARLAGYNIGTQHHWGAALPGHATTHGPGSGAETGSDHGATQPAQSPWRKVLHLHRNPGTHEQMPAATDGPRTRAARQERKTDIAPIAARETVFCCM